MIGSLSAQDEKQISLDPVTVSASLLEKRASETGRNLTVIRGSDLQDLPVNSLDEILRYLPGLEVQARGPMGAQSDIVLRGGTFQQVLVVLDGLRINDPTTGHFSSYIPVSPSEIDRIEILKGASSSLYGSEAVGGVVSVITKAFARSQATDQHFVEGGATAGMLGLWNARIGGYLKNDKLSLSGGVLSNNASGPELRGISGYFHNHTASVSARYQFDDNWHVAYRAAYDSRDFAAQNFYTVFASDTATEKVTGWLQQIEAGYRKEGSVLTFRGGYKNTTDRYRYNPVSIPNHNVSGLLQGLFTWEQKLSTNTDWLVGAHYQQRGIESNDRGDHVIHQFAPFVSASRRFGALVLHPSLRLDWRQRIGAELVPQLNVSYKLSDWQFRASGGRTIRDADFTERFNNYNRALVTGGSVGNPDLKAETSFSYEVGFDWFHRTNLKVSSSYFQRNQRDMIDYVPTAYDDMPRKSNLSPTGSYALARNIASVTTRGVELDVQYQYVLQEGERLHGMLGLTVMESRQPDAVPTFYLASHAKVLLNGLINYRRNRVYGSVNGLFKVREGREASALQTRIEPSYWVVNVKGGVDLIPRKLSVFVQADNLANARYSDLLGARMPGRWVMGGATFRWE